MATTNQWFVSKNVAKFETPAATSVGTGYTEIGGVTLGRGQAMIALEVENITAGQTTTGFKVTLRDYVGGEEYDYLVDTDFDSTSSSLLAVSTTGPHELTSAAFAHAHINTRAAIQAIFYAKVGASTTTMKTRGTIVFTD